jgi:hypothetical protein
MTEALQLESGQRVEDRHQRRLPGRHPEEMGMQVFTIEIIPSWLSGSQRLEDLGYTYHHAERRWLLRMGRKRSL